jgi:adenylosuccinate lyase
MGNADLNLMMPGHPRYQPKELKNIFGYDYLYKKVGEVEMANLKVLGDIGIIPAKEMKLLTPEIIEAVLQITTTEVDEIERITRHDIRAWIRVAQEIIRKKLLVVFSGKKAASIIEHSLIVQLMHVPLTSFDALDTARILQYLEAYHLALKPSLEDVVECFGQLTQRNASVLQIARTHGKHALPITVGFWLATVLSRIIANWMQMDGFAKAMVGKISGAVGAHNAQFGIGFAGRCGNKTYEDRVLEKLNLRAALISTQILPPEPLAYFLFSATMLSGALGQFGRDGRNLMRTEIAEIAEEFEEGQVGSSTMAHKRNPINFENLEGMYINTSTEFDRVMRTLISEHQRDLVGSSCARYFPNILINLQHQLNTLLKPNKKGSPFLLNIVVSEEMCRKNFAMSRDVILAEPLYIALLIAGYKGDAHDLVNQTLVKEANHQKKSLISVLIEHSKKDSHVGECVERMPREIILALQHPEDYVGDAALKSLKIVDMSRKISAEICK